MNRPSRHRAGALIIMELSSVIQRWHFRDNFSIRDISRCMGLARNTIRKYLRSDGASHLR
ncbi:hypothetical protein EFR84_18110 [Rhizobium chutanense]|uniref:HTH IS21-type domain-containing protein n=1 Tax=Rhizobium chutanense TaxID=2035448 RepID=A0A3S0QDI4_9HYPH|nr:hypothetical protein EFR84_18110 [Rhizobium chutanense]